ncbi:hypothetical protein [Massilia sp. MS-15]|uniref:hypothetical protein n=1 Tax=Massilia sp. MS-15 TaxID=2878200 RepID=UPI001CD2C6CD|nr:hypothetical protein [Massilia sp. MS-15]MCA1248494.1 hypothetical protein [Massilia sp. MS-15]
MRPHRHLASQVFGKLEHEGRHGRHQHRQQQFMLLRRRHAEREPQAEHDGGATNARRRGDVEFLHAMHRVERILPVPARRQDEQQGTGERNGKAELQTGKRKLMMLIQPFGKLKNFTAFPFS